MTRETKENNKLLAVETNTLLWCGCGVWSAYVCWRRSQKMKIEFSMLAYCKQLNGTVREIVLALISPIILFCRKLKSRKLSSGDFMRSHSLSHNTDWGQWCIVSTKMSYVCVQSSRTPHSTQLFHSNPVKRIVHLFRMKYPKCPKSKYNESFRLFSSHDFDPLSVWVSFKSK